MRDQLRMPADHGGQLSPEDRTAVPIAEPIAGGAAGAAGLQWLWGRVELRLGQAEPDTAA
jgi:hypothetical protein